MSNGKSVRKWLGAVACLLALFAATCASKPQPRERKGRHEVPLTEEELRVQLDGFADFFSATVQNAAGRITLETEDVELRRSAIVWKLRTVQYCRNAILLPNARESLVNVWSLCYQVRDYHHSDVGRQRFREFQDYTINAADVLLERIEEIADLVLVDDAFVAARDDIREFAEEHPVGQDWARAITLPSDAPEEDSSELHWVLSEPLAPFKPFSGIDKGADAIFELSKVADRASRRAEGMPQAALWELELMMIDILNSPRARESFEIAEQLNASVAEIGQASTSFAKTAETLPATIRAEVETAIENLEAQHEDFRETFASAQATVKDVRGALDDAKGVVKDVEELSDPAERTSAHVADAGKAWEGAIKAYHAMVNDFDEDEPEEPDPNERPFDIREYERTAKNLADTALELRKAIEGLRGLVGEDLQGESVTNIEKAANRTIERAAETLDELGERAFHRGLVFLGVSFLMALAVFGMAVVWLRTRRRG